MNAISKENKEPFGLNFERDRKNKVKIRARAYNVIKLPDGQICEKCKLKIATDRHHKDYNNPLEINFLCKSCHLGEHKHRDIIKRINEQKKKNIAQSQNTSQPTDI